MAKLPTDLSGREVRAALERVGFAFRRQTGSHMMLRRDQPYARAVVPSSSDPTRSVASSPTPDSPLNSSSNCSDADDGRRASLYRTIFPQMTLWLPEDEGAQLRFEFETEIARLEAA